MAYFKAFSGISPSKMQMLSKHLRVEYVCVKDKNCQGWFFFTPTAIELGKGDNALKLAVTPCCQEELTRP